MYITYVNHDSVIKQICQLKGNAYLINETDQLSCNGPMVARRDCDVNWKAA